MVAVIYERERLPDTRKSVTKKLKVGKLKVWVTVGLYDDGRPGELFLHIDRPPRNASLVWELLAEARGKSTDADWNERVDRMLANDSDEADYWSTLRGLLEAVAINTSMLLQLRQSIEAVAGKHIGTRFKPEGPTGDPAQPMASSILDLVFRWLVRRFPSGKAIEHPAEQVA